jgi:hypothetical protein
VSQMFPSPGALALLLCAAVVFLPNCLPERDVVLICVGSAVAAFN